MYVNSLVNIEKNLVCSVVGIGLRVTDKYMSETNTLHLTVRKGTLVKVLIGYTHHAGGHQNLNVIIDDKTDVDVVVTYNKVFTNDSALVLGVSGAIKSLTIGAPTTSEPWRLVVDAPEDCIVYSGAPERKNKVMLLSTNPVVTDSVALSARGLCAFSKSEFNVSCGTLQLEAEPTIGEFPAVIRLDSLGDSLFSQYLTTAPRVAGLGVPTVAKVISHVQDVTGGALAPLPDPIASFCDTAWVSVEEVLGEGLDNLLGTKKLPVYCGAKRSKALRGTTTATLSRQQRNHISLPVGVPERVIAHLEGLL